MSTIQRVYRIVIDSYPTPDGRPFDQQPPNDYETAVERHYNPGAPLDVPRWLEGVDLSEWLYTDSADWTEGPHAGAAIMGYDHEPMLTVPALRRVNYFSRSAALARLARLTSWGAAGRVESSDPLEWPTTNPDAPTTPKENQ